jgi:O-antigen biosynthesis protein WbqP
MCCKRLFDIVFALCLGGLLVIPMLAIAAAIRLSTRGPALYWSKRVGVDNGLFGMPKFRTMRPDTPQVATHLLEDPDRWLTPLGRFLRAHSLDELPQLWNILKGEMSFVGPRPALFNQDDLVALRTEKGVHRLVPGLTGWAQVNGRDELGIPDKVRLETEYLEKRSFGFDMKILFLTAVHVFRKEGVKH